MKTLYSKQFMLILSFTAFFLINKAITFESINYKIKTKPKNAITHLKEGDAYFKQYKLQEAIVSYHEALKGDTDKKMYLTRQIAKTYKLLFNYEDAKIWYEKLLWTSPEQVSAQDIIEYAHLLKNLQQYDKAIEVYDQYAKKMQLTNSEIEVFKASCEWAKIHLNDKVSYSVLPTNIQIEGVFLGADFYKSGLLFGAMQNDGAIAKTNYSDLSYSKNIDSISFDKNEKLTSKINGSSNDAHPSITSDGKTMYFTKNATDALFYNPKKSTKIEVNPEGTAHLNIFVSIQVNGEWTAPKRLSFNDKNFSCAYPFIDTDGQTLYFSSNRPGGFGGFDIYKATLKNDTVFSTPENLGQLINSSDDDFAPRLYDHKLYYSSRGKGGFGGADIFVSDVGENNAIGNPQNLGVPFNSSKDDFYILFKENNKEGYFASNREGEHGQDKLYYFKKIVIPPDTLSGIVSDRITNEALRDVEVSLIEINDKGDSSLVNTTKTDVNGHWQFIVSRDKKYKTLFALKDYYPKHFIVPATSKETLAARSEVITKLKDVRLSPVVKKNNIVKINNIYFDFNKAIVRTESYSILNNLVEFLKENPSANIELSAHTDGAGNDNYNLKLSNNRAKSCYQYLVANGIDLKRIVPKGYGEQKLLNNCKEAKKCSEMENQLNRRVEVKFL